MITVLRKLNWIVIVICLVVTWLPYFNIFNSAVLIAKVPEPLAVTLIANVILTICNFALYPLYYKPFAKALKKEDLEGGLVNE